MPCKRFAGTRLRGVQKKKKPSLRRYYLMLNEKITKQKTYQMPVYFFALLGFFVNHVIGPFADYTVSFFGW